MIVLHGGRIVDLHRNSTRRGDVLIDGNTIAAVGLGPKALSPGIRKINAEGYYILPGFIDSHTHLLAHGIELQRVDLGACRSPDDCLERLRSDLENKPAVLFGVNWDESVWRRGKRTDITKDSLDRIAGNIPVVMRRVCGHFAIVNTKALASVPRSWRIVDRAHGYLYEDAALYLNDLFPPSDEMYASGLEMAMNEALHLGITSVHEIVKPRVLRILQKLRGRLKLRFGVYIQEGLDQAAAAGLATGLGDAILKFCGTKFYLDGSIGAQTAAMIEPYVRTRNRGKLLLSRRRLAALVRKSEAHGLQLMVHAIGDRACALLAAAFGDCGLKRNLLRHRVEHVECAGSGPLAGMISAGLCLSMQPNFVKRWQGPGGMYEKLLGRRAASMNSFKTVIDTGGKLMFGSDSMPMGPLDGIGGAVDHPSATGRMSPAAALSAYTSGGAYGTFDEGCKGEIAAGMLADIVLVDRNPLVRGNIGQLKINKVIFDGKEFF